MIAPEQRRKYHREYMRSYLQNKENRERVKRWRRNYWAINRDKMCAETRKSYRKRVGGMSFMQKQEERLRHQYGLSVERYEQMLAEQGGGCAICKRVPQRPFGLDVDHDHITPRGKNCVVRALLCRRCNIAVGMVENFGPDIVLVMDYVVGYESSKKRWFAKAGKGLRV